MTLLEALQAGLAVEHQTIYGYGLAAAHLSKQPYRQALAALAAAEVRRDALAGRLRALGATPVVAAPAYLPPTPVTDASSAAALCSRLENAGAGAAWDLAVTAAAASAERRLAVEWLTAAAVSAARWSNSGVAPALPGAP